MRILIIAAAVGRRSGLLMFQQMRGRCRNGLWESVVVWWWTCSEYYQEGVCGGGIGGVEEASEVEGLVLEEASVGVKEGVHHAHVRGKQLKQTNRECIL